MIKICCVVGLSQRVLMELNLEYCKFDTVFLKRFTKEEFHRAR